MPNHKKDSTDKNFYYFGDEKIELQEAADLKAVRLKGAPAHPTRAALAARTAREDGGEELGLFGLTLYRADAETRGGAAAAARAPQDEAAETFPVFRTAEMGTDAALILTPQLIVQFKAGLSEADCKKLLNDAKLEVVSQDELAKNYYVCRPRNGSATEALAAANELHLKEQVEYAQPDFVRVLPEIAPLAGSAPAPAMWPGTIGEAGVGPQAPDTFFGSQWGLAKIKAPDAWGFTRGNPAIKVAVIDEGVDMTHEDLIPNLLTGYDAVDNDNNQQPLSHDGHGTACAGIVAAVADNGRGVAGVAPNCKIIPVRIAYGVWSEIYRRYLWSTSDSIIARGVRTAVARGADVLSNSWGGGPASSAIQAAFREARTTGRGGKGCFTPCATGNDNNRWGGVSYPAKYPECFGVGASTPSDQRKRPGDRTDPRNDDWGSNFGPEVDVVAPGVRIYTTDMMGGNGYTPGNYDPLFNGTSAATPHVAGVGALLLSIDPGLTVQEVEEIIKRTADDAGPAGRDNETGWGRVNAFRAALAAQRLWYDISVNIEFLGTGAECFMRINLRFYNPGINSVRLDWVALTSNSSDWSRELDSCECNLNPGGVMEPFTSQDVRFNKILLKAHGNRSGWAGNWRLHYSYTYWRPALPATPSADLARNTPLREFSDLARTESVSYRFEAQGRGRRQTLGDELDLNGRNPHTGALILPVSFAAAEPAVEDFGDSGNGLSAAGIVIEKTGETVRIKL